jgi:hypothetical protein
MLGAAALITAGQNFVIVRGRVVNVGEAIVEYEGEKVPTKTVSVIIENNDRVFRIERGTTVEYAVSDSDAGLVQVGAHVELLVSSHDRWAKVVKIDGGPLL